MEIDEELRFHIEQRTAENIANGMSPEAAARDARKRFGNLQTVREDCRDARGANFADTLLQDIRFGLRMLRKNPGFTTVAVLTLALGIGANTAIFSLLNTAILRPLPFRQPDRLMSIHESFPKLNLPATVLSPLIYSQCRKNCKAFEDIGAVLWWEPVLTGQTEPLQLTGIKSTASFLSVLGAAPVLGRYFTPEEDQPGGNHVAVLTEGFWRRQFGADPKVLGRPIMLTGTNYEVIGVLPSSVKFMVECDVWVPMAFTPEEWQYSGNDMMVVGRLKAGATVAQAQVELDGVAKPIRDKESYLAENKWTVFAQPFKEDLVGGIRPMLVLLSASVAMVLLIACVNVATLLLVAGISREKEMAIRSALGAGRFRLVRQLFVEGLVLSFLGAGVGLILGKRLMTWIAALAPPSLVEGVAGWDHVGIDLHVLGFTLAVTVASALVFGVVPALQVSRSNLSQPLKESSNRGSEGVKQRRLRTLLVIGEIALAMVLLAGAGVVLQGLLGVSRVDPGFAPDRLVSIRLNLPKNKYPSPVRQQAFFGELLNEVKSLPGVKSAALISNAPFRHDGGVTCSFSIDGRDDAAPGHGSPAAVSPQYFETMKIPVLLGHDFTDRDTADSPPVAIIDEKVARHYWPNQNPIGKRISVDWETLPDHSKWREIVGVVGEIKNEGLGTDAREQFYYPAAQSSTPLMSLMVRTEYSPGALLKSVQKLILTMDPDQPIFHVTSVRAQMDELLSPQRLSALLIGSFALLALGLAGIGLYGVVAYTTSQRTREFGIRLALGASHRQLIWLVLRNGMGMVAIGLTIGLLGGYAFGRLLSSLMPDIHPDDLRTYLFAALILAVVALAACWLPARRAAKIDPMTALRCE